MAQRSESQKRISVEPLYAIFEKNLFSFEKAKTDGKELVEKTVQEYLSFVKKRHAIVPNAYHEPVVQELEALVHEMLVKRIYGFFNVEQFRQQASPQHREQAESRYQQMKRKNRKAFRAKD